MQQTKIEAPPDIVPFDAYGAYRRESDANRRLYDLLTRALIVTESQARRLHNATGEDVSETLAFVRKIRTEALQ